MCKYIYISIFSPYFQNVIGQKHIKTTGNPVRSFISSDISDDKNDSTENTDDTGNQNNPNDEPEDQSYVKRTKELRGSVAVSAKFVARATSSARIYVAIPFPESNQYQDITSAISKGNLGETETGGKIVYKSEIYSRGDVLDYARRCYEYTAANYRYLNANTGLHTLSDNLKNGGGDCGNLSAIYLSLLRNKEIPARPVVCIRPDGSFHVWSEFYLEVYGWIPVDVTYKNSDMRGNYFGVYPGDCIVVSNEYDILLRNEDEILIRKFLRVDISDFLDIFFKVVFFACGYRAKCYSVFIYSSNSAIQHFCYFRTLCYAETDYCKDTQFCT